MTRFLLVRHASHGLLGGALAGRLQGVALDERGRTEAKELAQRLAHLPIAAIYASPQHRARETAAPLAEKLGLDVRVESAIDEIDFGDWTGKRFDELESEPHWRAWVDTRSVAQPPNGERFVDVRQRMISGMQRLRAAHPDQTVALVSHGDVIKAALAHVMRISLDDLERFDLAPASVSVIAAGEGWARVELVNDSGNLQR